jgi:hypothetical protein
MPTEWLVASGSAPASIHDEYGQALMEGAPILHDAFDHIHVDLNIKLEDSETIRLYKIYRTKLQHFLRTSMDFHPERIMRYLPSSFLHEYALLLSRIGRHEEVLRLYIHQLNNITLAEEYCNRIHTLRVSDSSNTTILNDISNVYFCLFKVMLTPPMTVSEGVKLSLIPDKQTTLKMVIRLAVLYFDRFDPALFLDLLPPNMPLAALSTYLSVVLEFANNKKKNLQVSNLFPKHVLSSLLIANRSSINCYAFAR